ncbi:uncharacterized protein LOC126750343 isoform X2 [Anthonomus grandis grandis]|uniref:uncharacterized protein LOC126750343 isoform X2 n=1 Tax=Anthonomus grandis grandis TaxID=2921223 RepID=UPI0021665D10|nr:uncharacterized protein LOC126750343 isoform X2 [Anthonomus grandis grandis]
MLPTKSMNFLQAIFNNAIDTPFSSPIRSPFISTIDNIGLRQGLNTATFGSLGPFSSNFLRRRCPICDSSVYGYCSEKLFHDSCCCSDPNDPYDRLPYQCQYADCSFLHANSCREHKLISACCCTNFVL